MSLQMSRQPTDCDSKRTPEPSVLDAGTESACVEPDAHRGNQTDSSTVR